MQSTVDDVSVPAAAEDSLLPPTSEKCLDLQESSASSRSVDASNDMQDVLPGDDNEPCLVANKDDNCEHVTDDMQDVTDPENNLLTTVPTDETVSDFSPSECENSDVDAEHFPETTESVSENENVACDRLQETDTVEQEPGAADIGLTAETKIEQNKNDNEPRSLAAISDTDDNEEHITVDMPAATDTDKRVDNSLATAAAAGGFVSNFSPSESEHSDVSAEHFPETTESVGENESLACDSLQDSGKVKQELEPGPVDIGLSAETEVELNKNDSDELDGCRKTEKMSYFQETELEAAASNVDGTVNNSTDILTVCGNHIHSCEQWESVNDRNNDALTCSESVQGDRHDRNNPEATCVSVEPACSTVSDNLNANMKFYEEAMHENESGLQLESESSSPESLQKKLSDADMQKTILDLKHTVR